MIFASEKSQILNDFEFWQICQFLPSRAKFNQIELLFATSKNGFSLKNLYRRFSGNAEEIRGTFLVIKDSEEKIFGAVLNCPILPKNHFYGNGESLLFSFWHEFRIFPWTGKNNFIVKADTDSLIFGASSGKYGLWMDSEFLRGRSEFCATFENDPLAQNENFTISEVEVWVALA